MKKSSRYFNTRKLHPFPGVQWNGGKQTFPLWVQHSDGFVDCAAAVWLLGLLGAGLFLGQKSDKFQEYVCVCTHVYL